MRNRAMAMSGKIGAVNAAKKAGAAEFEARRATVGGAETTGKVKDGKAKDDMSMLRSAAMGAHGSRKAEYERAAKHQKKS